MAPTLSTIHSTVFFDEEDETQYVQPILIYFSGTLPRDLLHNTIPIQVSVTIAQEYCSFISPIIGTVPDKAFYCNSHSSIDDDDDMAVSRARDDSLSVSFLPLPSTFHHLNPKHWASLCSTIQRWLVSIPNQSQHWTWGRDVFWLAYVAAYPDFPAGDWPIWDSRISPKGTFIEGWMDGTLVETVIHTIDDLGDKNVHEQVRLWVWDEFCRVASLFHPDPLISALS